MIGLWTSPFICILNSPLFMFIDGVTGRNGLKITYCQNVIAITFLRYYLSYFLRIARMYRRALRIMQNSIRVIHPTKIQKSDEEWKSILTPMEYEVLRRQATEPQFYQQKMESTSTPRHPCWGYYACRGCGLPLYSSNSKYDAGCGWPSFDKCFLGAVATATDSSHGMTRTEICCGRCEGHLGHVFHGEQHTPTNERHCVNSVSVRYVNEAIPDMYALSEGTVQHTVKD